MGSLNHSSCNQIASTNRKIKTIDSEKFGQDLLEKFSNLTLPIDVTDAFSLFDESMCTVLDKHAPLQEKIISIRPKMPWYTTESFGGKEGEATSRKEMESYKLR